MHYDAEGQGVKQLTDESDHRLVDDGATEADFSNPPRRRSKQGGRVGRPVTRDGGPCGRDVRADHAGGPCRRTVWADRAGGPCGRTVRADRAG